jgi:hypothetical protein
MRLGIHELGCLQKQGERPRVYYREIVVAIHLGMAALSIVYVLR